MTERARGIERDRAAAVDHDVVASLEAEAASLNEQLAGTHQEAQELLPLEAELGTAQEDLALQVAQLKAALAGGGGEALAGERAGEVRAELAARLRAVEQVGSELARTRTRADVLAGRKARLEEEEGRSDALARQCADRGEMLSAAAERAAARLAGAEQALATAQEARRAVDAERHRWSARAEALSQALDEARGGARRLAGVEGMVGALVELVDVDAGYEAAFEAAAGEALSAVLMSDEEAARRGLAHLAEHNAAGAVIALAQGIRTGRATDGTALGDGPRPGEGPRPGDGPADELPTGARWLSGLVRSPQSAVTDLLSRLLARAVVVTGDWSPASTWPWPGPARHRDPGRGPLLARHLADRLPRHRGDGRGAGRSADGVRAGHVGRRAGGGGRAGGPG